MVNNAVMKITKSDKNDNYQISGAAWTEHSWHFSSWLQQKTGSTGDWKIIVDILNHLTYKNITKLPEKR